MKVLLWCILLVCLVTAALGFVTILGIHYQMTTKPLVPTVITTFAAMCIGWIVAAFIDKVGE